MNRPLTKISLALETNRYCGTGGVSENNRSLGFQPGFIDRETETAHLSRFPDGRLAPCHLLDGLPSELVLARDEQGRVTRVKSSVYPVSCTTIASAPATRRPRCSYLL